VIWTAFSLFALLVWAAVLLLPSQPCRIRERLEASNDFAALDEVTVLIPARNEAAVIGRTLSALREQGPGLEIIVIDDGSDDETAAIAAGVFGDTEEAPIAGATAEPRTGNEAAAPAPASPAITIVTGEPLPRGWGGKLWALQQGLSRVRRPYTLLLDADIVLAPGMLASLLEKIHASDARLVSIMARLRCENFWERLLVPPFIFFFKLIYPFARVQDPGERVAAAAGGCLLVETAVLREVDAFTSIRHALIDDCALASRIKGAGYPIWLGLSDSVLSTRAYTTLDDFWRMVSRTAFTQLRYSVVLLLVTTVLMLAVFVLPLIGFVAGSQWAMLCAFAAVGLMALAYFPVVRFYELPAGWTLTLPVAGVLYLAMTWSSALQYWRGTRATWKNRAYDTAE